MKGERIAQLELLLRSHPEGLRRSEIARRLGVHRSTISRYVEDLGEHIDLYEDNNLIKIKPKEDDDTMSLSIYESLAFNISAEILASNSDMLQNPHLASGLRKMAMNMRSYAPKIADNMLAVAEKIDQEVQKDKSRYTSFNATLEVLIDAWVTGRIVRIATNNAKQDEIEMTPYFIGFREEDKDRHPITVTGRLRHTKEIITLDIASITNVTLLDETYTIPDNLKPFKMAQSNDESYDAIDMIPLRLRLKEKSAVNAFHGINHSEFLFDKQSEDNLYCSFKAENSIELMMKIFQCGDSVEILEPESYKKRYLDYLKEILAIYGK